MNIIIYTTKMVKCCSQPLGTYLRGWVGQSHLGVALPYPKNIIQMDKATLTCDFSVGLGQNHLQVALPYPKNIIQMDKATLDL